MVSQDSKILLIRLSAIGDVVHALHAVAALRQARPDAHLGFLVEDRAASLVKGHPDLDAVHVFPRKAWQKSFLRTPAKVAEAAGDFVAELRGARYDVAVDLQGNLKGGVLSRLSGAPRRIGLARGFGREGNHRFQTEWVSPPPMGPQHRVDRALLLVSPLGVDGPGGTLAAPIAPEDRDLMDAWLAEQGLPGPGYAVLHPGTSEFGEFKRWPPERFGQAARGLAERTGLRSVATWGPGEEDLADRVAAASDGAAIRGPRTPSLGALAHLARRASLFVGADTGALHLAALLGTPTLGLFGPKDPRVYGPRGEQTAVIHKGVDCSPCGRRHCDDPVCMDSITVDDVLDAAEGLLSTRTQKASGGR